MDMSRRKLIVLKSLLERCNDKDWSDYVKTDIV